MHQQRPLSSLLEGCDAHVEGDSDLAVLGIAYDSRAVRPGQAFVAVPGFRYDGLAFVAQALERGAIAVISEQPRPATTTDARIETWVRVPDARRALAHMSCAWYHNPSHELCVVGVTGTNGKTTVTALVEALLATRGPAGRWSTTQVRLGGVSHPTPRTTPESLDLQHALAQMVAAGCRAAAIEVSSHALSLKRTAGTRFAGAVFTNLSPDHLDFHHTMDEYLAVKALLFSGLPETAPAVVNFSDPVADKIVAACTGRVVGYGWAGARADHRAAAYQIHSFTPAESGSVLQLETPTGIATLRTPLFGRANAENLAAGIALALELGIDPAHLVDPVLGFGGEPGRLERIEVGQRFSIFVDFAHTPAALEAALEAARSATDGLVHVVFGCGGDRDRTKRAPMGRIAAVGADRVTVTSDNPRSESPETIVRDIMAGIPHESRGRVAVEIDRARAIADAIAAADDGDCVLIAGKGHETEQIFADHTIPFDDRSVAAEAARRLVATRTGETH